VHIELMPDGGTFGGGGVRLDAGSARSACQTA
jgi:hypothetical protein